MRLWGEGTYLGEIGGPAELGGAQLAGAGSVAVSSASDQTYVADTNHNRVLVYGPEGIAAGEVGSRRRRRRRRQRPGRLQPSRRARDRAGRRTSTSPTPATTAIVELSPDGQRARRVGLQRHGRRPLSRSRPAWRWTRPATCTCSTAKTTAWRCSTRADASWPSGACAATAPGEFSQPAAIAVDCNGDVYVADTNNNRVERFDLASPAGSRLPGARPLAAAAERRTGAARQRSARRRRARAPRARAGGELPARLQDPRHRDARARRRRPRPVALISAARGLAGEGHRPRAAARRAERAAPPAQGAGPPQDDAGTRDDRRRRADRPAHDRHAQLTRQPLSARWRARRHHARAASIMSA